VIGYPVSRGKLRNLIEEHVPGWLDRASERTAQFRKQRKYRESGSIWSEVKAVYMKLQCGCKCAFCERKLESEEYGKGEQAVEHFRPKGNVKAWKPPAALAAQGIVVAPAPLKRGGYYLLPYDVFNYSAACIPCNSALKKDYFPVAGKHRLSGTRPEALLTERPQLIYPIGDFDDRPEKLIRFNGLSPHPVARAGDKRSRALVTIEFFQLDDLSRKNLIRERAMVIVGLFPALRMLEGKSRAAEKQMAQEIIKGFTAANSAHTNCARSFRRLYRSKPAEAADVFERAAALLSSKS
jgi:hypothetical protein